MSVCRMESRRLVADNRFSSHQAGVTSHMGLTSLNVTYPTSSTDEKKTEHRIHQPEYMDVLVDTFKDSFFAHTAIPLIG